MEYPSTQTGRWESLREMSPVLYFHGTRGVHQFVCSQSLALSFAPPKNQVSFRLFVKSKDNAHVFECLVECLGVSEVLW
jgi:hypothetical protein